MNPVRVVNDRHIDLIVYCQGVERKHWLAFLAKWTLDTTALDELSFELYKTASHIAASEKWRMRKDRDYVQEMADMAVFEMQYPKLLDTGEKRAEYMGINKSNWYRNLGSKYQAVYGLLNEWTNIAYRKILKNQEM